MDYKKIADNYRDEYYKVLKDLIGIKSIYDENTVDTNAPFGKGCRDALDYMLNLAKKDGFKTIDYNGYAGVIEYGESKESIGMLAHLDLVTIGEGWTHDPFGAELIDGFVFGRGVADDKGPAVSAYFAMKALKDLNIKPKRKIMLILGCDEESGMACMNYYVKHGEIPTLGFTPDADFPLIYAESGMLGFEIEGQIDNNPISYMNSGERSNVVLANATAIMNGIDNTQIDEFNYYLKAHNISGSIDVADNKINFIGRAAHAMECYCGLNAGLHLLNYVGISYDNMQLRKLYSLLQDWRGTGFNIDINGSYMGFLTMNIGKIKIENNKINITIDIRYPNDVTAQELIEKIQSKLDFELPGYKMVNIDTSHMPLFVDPNSEFIKVLMNSYQEITGDYNTPAQAIRGGTYAKCFKNFVAFGPEKPTKRETNLDVGSIHQANEAIYFDDLIEAIAIYLKAIVDLQDVKI